MKKQLKLSFQSEIFNVRQAVKKILLFLHSSMPGLSPDDQMELRLIFSELLCNAVVHGNKGDAGKSVQLDVEVDGDIVYATIADEGVGFDYTGLLQSLDKDADLLSECGRGIRLVSSLTDKLEFNMPGNAIQFYKKVASNG
jgi:serine/threonine-protein kinase RsbW